MNLLEKISGELKDKVDKTAKYNPVLRQITPHGNNTQIYLPVKGVLAVLGYTKGDVDNEFAEMVKINGKIYHVPHAVSYHIRNLTSRVSELKAEIETKQKSEKPRIKKKDKKKDDNG